MPQTIPSPTAGAVLKMTASGLAEWGNEAVLASEIASGAATDGQVLTADGAGVSAWESLPTSSATVQGVVELATNAEAKTGTDTARAMTAANLRSVLTGLKFISFDGINGAGACTAAGAVVGDKVLYVAGLTGGALGNANASFEATVTVIDQIQQSAVGDLSSNDYLAVLLAVA